jgi:hypothetical protein
MKRLPRIVVIAVCMLLTAAPTALFAATDAQAATARPKLLHLYAAQALKGKTMVVTAQFSAPASDGAAKAKVNMCVASHCGTLTVPSNEGYSPQVLLQHFDEVGHMVTIKISLTISGTRFTYSKSVKDFQSEMG